MNLKNRLRTIPNKTRLRKDQLYDKQGRMPQGKYEFTKFEEVPVNYLRWVKESWNLAWYPNLERYLEECLSDREDEDMDDYDPRRLQEVY